MNRNIHRLCVTAAVAISTLAVSATGWSATTTRVPLPGHNATELPGVRASATIPASTKIDLLIGLPLPNKAGLAWAIQQMYNKKSPQYHHFLTPETFAAQYGPSTADYNAVIQWATANGLKVTKTFTSRLGVDVSGPASAVQKAFAVNLASYALNGRSVRLPNVTPSVPSTIAPKIAIVAGIDTMDVATINARRRDDFLMPNYIHPNGSGPYGGLAPSDYNTAYTWGTLNMDGAGQTIALYELDNYNSSDILGYESQFGITNADVETRAVDGYCYPPTPGDAQGEVTLDIELALGVAPKAKILVYEDNNINPGIFNNWLAIANDNKAKSISTSWASPENLWDDIQHYYESFFMQMASQGQSVYAASGDGGAYYWSWYSWDPPTDPYVCGVGATALTLGSNASYGSETTWHNSAGGSGGGVSTYWTKPSYQTGLGASTTMRDVPDVALDGDPATGYAVYSEGRWGTWGGTSCSAPVFAGYNALIDEQLAATNQSYFGFPNPTFYTIGADATRYGNDFHDINDNSDNGHFHATTGYDDCTGWGTPKGLALWTDLTGYSASNAPGAPQGLTTTGAHSQVTLNWGRIYGATSYNVYRGTATGAESMTPLATSLTSPTYVDSTATNNNSTYYYKVAAVNANGTGALSSEVAGNPGSVPPIGPTNLAETVDSGVVNLTWTSGVGCGSGYYIYRGDKSNCEAWAPIASVSGSTFAYTDRLVSNYTKYYYKVAGYNPSGVSAMSNEVFATPGEHPFPPSNLVALGGSNQVVLTWTASLFYATSYNIYRATTAGAEGTTPYATGVTGTTYTDTNAPNGNTFFYTVAGVDAYGPSTMTNEASATTNLPDAPQGLVATALSSTSIGLNWTANGANSINIYRSLKSGGPYTQCGTATTNSFADSGARPATTYYYTIASVAGGFTSAKSSEASATTPPAAPTGLKAKALSSGGEIDLIWMTTVGATSYNILRGTQTGGPYSSVGTSSTPAYQDTNVSGGTGYYYVVQAVNSGGASPNSSEASTATVAAAPSTLTATGVGSAEIDLSWSAATGATAYSVQRSTRQGGPYTKIATVPGSTSYHNMGLAPDATYYYVVASVNIGGVGPISSEASASTAPLAPGGLHAKTNGSTEIDLTFTPLKGADSYIILRGTSSGGPYTVVGTPSSSPYADSGLAAATQYYYVLQAVSNGIASANSSEATATTTPTAPSTLTVSSTASTSVGLTWTASTGATSYGIYRSVVSGGPYTKVGYSMTNSATQGGLNPSTTYYFVVTANNAGGPSTYSPEATTTTLSPTPGGLRAKTASSSEIDLVWSPCKGAQGYNVLRGTSLGGPYTLIGTASALWYQDAGLTSATQYYYVVQANNTAGGASGNSNEATSTTSPAAPTNLTVASTASANVGLTWTASTGATAYVIMKSVNSGGPYIKVATASTNSATVSGLQPNATYYFVAAGVNAGGIGDVSGEVSATTLPPSATGLHGKSVGDTEIDLAWMAARGAGSYTIWRSTTQGTGYQQIDSSSTATYQDTSVLANTTYYYVVQAVGTEGGNSSNSNEAAITTAPSAPAGLSATNTGPTTNSLTWSASTGATSYTIWRSLISGDGYVKIGSSSTNSYTSSGLHASTTYYYVVTATGAGGTSFFSQEANASTP